ncbi:M36 family metallopeptidase [Nannocystis sp. SCPEA4]|uniref:M36 family metallopeptidase n=1 Tax=Nannocystis sp. SCPEA4 TaxID=2996787 RepID=UPI0022719F67|nr:M36 family metallopeptidase [Nannocystis sp. SCPEA4]MCY1054722.1 M36 family metallopeptidase [Nannocystis sp. SCPEA4]
MSHATSSAGQGRRTGRRTHPYDADYPGKFGDIGSGSYDSPHAVGEIWCAALMQLTRNLAGVLGKPRGYAITWQAVIDGIKLTPKSIIPRMPGRRLGSAG